MSREKLFDSKPSGFRNEDVQTAEDLYEQLGDMPELMEVLDKH